MNLFKKWFSRKEHLVAPKEPVKGETIESLKTELDFLQKEYEDLLVDYCELGNKYLKLINRSIENGKVIIVSKN